MEEEEVVAVELAEGGEAPGPTGPEPEKEEEKEKAEGGGPEPEKEKAEEEAAEAAAGGSDESEVALAVVVAEEQEAAPLEAPAEEEAEAPKDEAAAEQQEGDGEPPPAPEGEEKKKEEEEEEQKPPEEEAPPEEPPAGKEGARKEEEEKEEEATPELEPSPSSPPPEAELPIAVTFPEGEEEEGAEAPKEPSPQLLGAELVRRISLSLWDLDQLRGSSGPSVGSSPESAGSGLSPERETEEQLAARRALEQRHREELLHDFRQLQAERRRLRHDSLKLQSKLAELLLRGGGGVAGGKEAAAAARAEPLEQHISDREQRYGRYLAMLAELRAQQEAEGAWYQRQLGALQASCREKQAAVKAEWEACQAAKKEVAVFTMGRRLGGKRAAKKEVDLIQAREQAKEDEMTEVRLEYIKLKHRIQKLEASLKAQEELAEGLHLIDFEQLKIENQTYNEKIEERNEELLKLRRKITNTVQIISQVKEKLQFVEAENQVQKSQLMEVEALVAQKREILTKTKQARDNLRLDNERLQQKCGLLGHPLLLRDFENKVNAAEALKERLEGMRRRHAGLSLSCKGVKKKLEGVTSFLPL